MDGLVDRAVRAAKLDASLYEEVEADQAALGQAMTVVVVSSVCAGIGSAAQGGVVGLLFGAVGSLIGWYIWAYLTYFIGTKLLPEAQTSANVGELLRTTGFSSSPGALRILGVIPGLMTIVFVISSVWMLVAMIVAVRQALDYTSTGRAVGVCLIGWLVMMAIFSILAVIAAPGLVAGN
ncbi:MAG TPA: YIP1 family protein [Candidatus Binatia bacterium]|nr:YIP1 family protein [Candidatus Binatia bacterium]